MASFISGADLTGMNPRTEVNGSMTYLYGLSDFWVTMFADKDLVDSLLEVSTIQLSDAYSQFLQRAGNISLQTIQHSYNSELALLLLSDEDCVDPLSGTTYRLKQKLTSVRYIMNRPLLPTITLTAGVNFEINTEGTEITFYRPLASLGFPTRITASGVEQVALWMSDVNVDEDIIYRQFGRTVNISQDKAIGNYRDFVEGLYYLYSHGPIIDYTITGVNLALGIPTARATEQVMAVLQDPKTGHWQILTPKYFYEIPYGFSPNILVGDTLTEGQQLTSWVDLKDHRKDGTWWYNTFIPKELTGGVQFPPVTPNSDMDFLMKEYLRFNTFMVLFQQAGISLDGYYTVSDIIFRARPAHTYPMFVWAAPMGDEIVNINDDDLVMGQKVDIADTIYDSRIIDFVRSDQKTYFSRGVNAYTRTQIPKYHQGMLGDNPKLGEFRGVNQDGTRLSGIGGWVDEAQEYVEEDAYRLNPVLATRGTKAVPRGRSTGMRSLRGHEIPVVEALTLEYRAADGEKISLNSRDIVPLYMCHLDELLPKLTKIKQDTSVVVPGSPPIWVKGVRFKDNYDDIIIRSALDDAPAESYDPQLEKVFTFKYTKQPIPPVLSRHAGLMYVPRKEDLPDVGSLILSEIYQDYWSVSIVAEDPTLLPTYQPVDDGDPMDMELTFEQRPGSSALTRGTYLANPAVVDARANQEALYNDGRSSYSIKMTRGGNPGTPDQPLRAYIRRD